MSVELEPAELGFKRTDHSNFPLRDSNLLLTEVIHLGPFTHEVSQTLRLYNPNTEPVAFKVKTTAPKQ